MNIYKPIFFFFLKLVLLHNFCSATAEKVTEQNLIEVVQKMVEENRQLRQGIEKLNHLRDVESDIEEIKNVLESYGKDLTSLRIQQGYLLEAVSKHDVNLLSISSQLAVHSDKLSTIDESLGNHQTLIDENHAGIESHTQILSDHGGRIQTNTDGINANVATIQEHQSSISANSQNIQLVTDNYNNYRSSQVKFVADTPCCGEMDSDLWPDNTRVWYKTKHLDTHNAVSDSQFFAPITGFYSFTFTADFRICCDSSRIIVSINENNIRSYLFDSFTNDNLIQTYSVSFTPQMNQGDRMDLAVSGDSGFDISANPATLTGYFLH